MKAAEGAVVTSAGENTSGYDNVHVDTDKPLSEVWTL